MRGDAPPPPPKPRPRQHSLVHEAAGHHTTARGTHAAPPWPSPTMQPPVFVTGMAHQAVRWTTQRGGTLDVAVNITVHLILSGFPPSPGVVLHQDANVLHLRVERPIAAAGAPSQPPSAPWSRRGGGAPGHGPVEAHKGDASAGGSWFWTGLAPLQSRVVHTVE